MNDDGLIVTIIENEPGRVTLALWERHETEQEGSVMRKELDLFEMERLHAVLTKALWAQIRNLTP